MGSAPARIRARMRSQQGLTLVELMITVSILVVVLLATFALLDTSRKAASSEQQRSDSVREAQSGLQRMAKELRAAYQMTSASSNSLTIVIRCKTGETCPESSATDPGKKLVTYTCTTSCLRGESTTADAATGKCCAPATVQQPVISRVLNRNQPDGSAWPCPYTANTDAAGPIFTYRVRQPFATPPQLARACGPTSPNAIDVTISVPAAGEKTNQGYRRAIILRDAVYLRNMDL